MLAVNAALVAFIFVGIIFPHLIKHKAQFYAAVALVVVLILLSPLLDVGFFKWLIAILQATAVLVLVLASGGLSARDLAGEFANAYEVIRRGEDKPIVVPIGKQKEAAEEHDEGRVVYEATPEDIRKAQEQVPPQTPPPPKPPDDGSLPLA